MNLSQTRPSSQSPRTLRPTTRTHGARLRPDLPRRTNCRTGRGRRVRGLAGRGEQSCRAEAQDRRGLQGMELWSQCLHGRRGRFLDGHGRLPGVPHRPILRRPDPGHDLPARRQLRRARRRHRCIRVVEVLRGREDLPRCRRRRGILLLRLALCRHKDSRQVAGGAQCARHLRRGHALHHEAPANEGLHLGSRRRRQGDPHAGLGRSEPPELGRRGVDQEPEEL
mmetsp:Transcript_70149/g.201023  ORF Transcript_70149/g.201023 Transcript_70149/m.201023 type:complete len:224 (-) Transcript_70149:4215-4886(-)